MSADPTSEIDALARGLDSLRDRLVAVLGDEAHLLIDTALESARANVEELRVVEDEMRAQNDELVEAQLALEVERQRLADLFVDAPDAYVVTDARGTIRDANRAAARLLAVPPPYLERKPLAAFVAVADRRAFRRAVAAAASGGEADPVTIRLVRRDGVLTWCEARSAARVTTDGFELRWALRDVTDRVQTERALWDLNAELELRVGERTEAVDAQRARLETVLRQLPVGIVIVDATTQRVQTANAAAAAVLGADAVAEGARVEGLALREPAGEPVAYGETPSVVTAKTGAPTIPTTYLLETSRGDIVVEVASGAVTGLDGTVEAVVLTVEDVTDRDRRARADREFVSNAAHQLRTPLTAIASAVAVLQGGAKDDPAAREKFLGHLQRETDRLSRLGRALLTLARAQRGEQDAPLAIVRLRPLLDGVVAEHPAKEGVQLTVACPDDVGALTNEELLEEALSNLVGNGVAYTDHGSVHVAARADDGEVVIEVSDTGHGIRAAESAVVFERFYRADGSSGAARGFGLGLPIAKAAVDAAGGSLELESEQERGTVARIRLRAARVVA